MGAPPIVEAVLAVAELLSLEIPLLDGTVVGLDQSVSCSTGRSLSPQLVA